MGTGLQEIPFRIPEKWDAAWFQRFIRDVLALADARNSIGDGLTVSGESNTQATYSVDADIKNLVDQAFVLMAPSAYLPNERVLEAAGGLELIDTGAGGTVTVQIANGSIPFDKLEGLNTFGVLGRAPEDPGGPEQILASQNGDVLCVQSDVLGFTSTPLWTGHHTWIDGIAARFGTDGDLALYHDDTNAHIDNATGILAIASAGGLTVNGETLAEIAQDAVGTILTDSDTIDFTYDDGVPSITAEVIESYAYEWTANHTWADNAEVRLGTDGDLRLYHDGTDSFIRNDTGVLRFYLNGTPQNAYFGSTQNANLSVSEAPNVLVERSVKVIRTSGANIRGYAYGSTGTLAAPGGTRNNDNMLQVAGAGYDTSAFATGAGFQFNASENWAVGAHGSELLLFVTPNGSASSFNAIIVRNTGNVQIPTDNREIQIGAGQDLRLYHDGTDSFIRNDTGVLNINEGAVTVGRFDADSTAGNTRFMVYDVDNGTLERVSVGAADSGGLGFKLLRIPN